MEALILTKSAMKKNGMRGSCVTAHDLKNNRLVRFVSDREGSPIPYQISCRFELFDYVSVPVIESYSLPPQTENLVVGFTPFYTTKRYQPEVIEEVYRMLPPLSSPRFMDERGDSPERLYSVKDYSHSLELIRVSGLRILRKVYPDKKTGKANVKGKAQFFYSSYFWDAFSVTDPKFDIRKTNLETWVIGDAYMMVSIPTIPNERDGLYYKFIAAIYPIT